MISKVCGCKWVRESDKYSVKTESRCECMQYSYAESSKVPVLNLHLLFPFSLSAGPFPQHAHGSTGDRTSDVHLQRPGSNFPTTSGYVIVTD